MNVLVKILFYCMLVSQAMSYYFYNAKTKQVLTTSTLNVPKGFRIMRPPKTLKFNREIFTHGLYCQDIGFSCTQQFNYSSTYQFECENDSNCPKSFICCPQKCFKHRVCTKAATKLITKNSNTNMQTVDSNRCEKFPYNCYQPYPIHLTYKFRCDYDGQCPSGFKCCQQDCFTHKICAKSYKKVKELRMDDNKTTKLNSKGINDNREMNEYLQANYSVENTTNLIRTTREVETVTEQNKSTNEEEEEDDDEEEEEEEKHSTEKEGNSTEENSTEEKNSTEEEETEENSSTTRDPNGINPNYRDYYENEYDEEEEH